MSLIMRKDGVTTHFQLITDILCAPVFVAVIYMGDYFEILERIGDFIYLLALVIALGVMIGGRIWFVSGMKKQGWK